MLWGMSLISRQQSTVNLRILAAPVAINQQNSPMIQYILQIRQGCCAI